MMSSRAPPESISSIAQSPKHVTASPRNRPSSVSAFPFNTDMPDKPFFSASSTSKNGSNSDLHQNGMHKNESQSNPAAYPGRYMDSFEAAKEQEIFVFVEPPNKKLCCAVCTNVFTDPVITTCGHTFCRECVRKSANEICPIDKKPSKYIVDNIALSEQIGELLIRCKFGCKKYENKYVLDDKGCDAVLKLSERLKHYALCDYAPVSCQYSSSCGQFYRKDLQKHMQSCTSASCPNEKNGCKFIGTKLDLDKHSKECVYTFAKDRDLSFDVIKQENKSAREDIDFLFTSLQGLSQRFEQLEAEKDQLIGHIDRMAVALEDSRKEAAEARRERQVILEELDQLKQAMFEKNRAIPVTDPDIIIKCKGTCVGHDGPVWCLAVNNDYLFSGSSDNHVKVWDIGSNYKCIKTLTGHSGIVLALTVYGNRLYSGSQDTKILVWNIDKNFELEDTLDAHDNPVCTLAASRAMLFSGSLKTVKVWSAESGKHRVKKEITGFNHWVRALYATDKELYCGSYQTIEIYNLDTLEVTTTLKTYGGSVYSISVTDKHIYCGTYEKVIHVWELATMEQVTTLQGHSGTVYGLSWMPSPSGILVFSASYDRTIRVWSQTYMICRQTLIRHAGSVTCLAVSKGRIFSGGIDSMIKVWQ